MHKLIVYLAGTMTGLTYEQMTEWRARAARQLRQAGFAVIDPCERITFENVVQLNQHAVADRPIDLPASEIVDCNLYHISHSDIILAEFEYPGVSIGTIGEVITSSRELHLPVIAWGTNRQVLQHAWLRKHITAHRDSLDDAIAHIIEVYKGAE